MRANTALFGWVVILSLSHLVAEKLYPQSPANGVLNGYVGSDKWFSEMRKSAANQAMLKALSGKSNPKRLPTDFIEVAGIIRFPNGNPFPAGQLPDLRIQGKDPKTDSVERAPYVSKDGSFYTVLKKGQTYDLYWMYYFGSREKFASIHIEPAGKPQRKYSVEYITETEDPVETKSPAPDEPKPRDPPAIPVPKEEATPPADADEFDLSGFPSQPTNFEEQTILESIKFAASPALKAIAHEKLASYYKKNGPAAKAQSEYAKAHYWQKQNEGARPNETK